MIIPDYGGSTYLLNLGRQLFYTAVHPRIQFWTSYSPPWELEISQTYYIHKENERRLNARHRLYHKIHKILSSRVSESLKIKILQEKRKTYNPQDNNLIPILSKLPTEFWIRPQQEKERCLYSAVTSVCALVAYRAPYRHGDAGRQPACVTGRSYESLFCPLVLAGGLISQESSLREVLIKTLMWEY
jgi:hypothetical protein